MRRDVREVAAAGELKNQFLMRAEVNLNRAEDGIEGCPRASDRSGARAAA